jgi:hypothetical protein
MLPCFIQAILNALFIDLNKFRDLTQVTPGRSVLLENRSWLTFPEEITHNYI